MATRDVPPGPALDPAAVEAVAAAARQKDPGLPPETATLLAGQATELLRAQPDLDAPTLARTLMADNPDVGATPANVVATAALGTTAP